ncbi:hypothetical protein C8F04DRAFT_1274914 [Mycena alexandri]|uniref:Uncharacterized protein n=1 Tax=Mycena alexandri TaxID=1745969 RepID=A0AAD6S606_9AGAR|nr:hypothetical protein C8F04DRAFT_1274914 [Mycena alexandri]
MSSSILLTSLPVAVTISDVVALALDASAVAVFNPFSYYSLVPLGNLTQWNTTSISNDSFTSFGSLVCSGTKFHWQLVGRRSRSGYEYNFVMAPSKRSLATLQVMQDIQDGAVL